MNRTLISGLATLAAGGLFGFGLSLSTMIQPKVVLGFLLFKQRFLLFFLCLYLLLQGYYFLG